MKSLLMSSTALLNKSTSYFLKLNPLWISEGAVIPVLTRIRIRFSFSLTASLSPACENIFSRQWNIRIEPSNSAVKSPLISPPLGETEWCWTHGSTVWVSRNLGPPTYVNLQSSGPPHKPNNNNNKVFFLRVHLFVVSVTQMFCN